MDRNSVDNKRGKTLVGRIKDETLSQMSRMLGGFAAG